MTSEKPEPYVASNEQHGAALGRALAYCLLHGLGKVSYEQVQGTIHGVEHGRVRFVFEVDAGYPLTGPPSSSRSSRPTWRSCRRTVGSWKRLR